MMVKLLGEKEVLSRRNNYWIWQTFMANILIAFPFLDDHLEHIRRDIKRLNLRRNLALCSRLSSDSVAYPRLSPCEFKNTFWSFRLIILCLPSTWYCIRLYFVRTYNLIRKIYQILNRGISMIWFRVLSDLMLLWTLNYQNTISVGSIYSTRQ